MKFYIAMIRFFSIKINFMELDLIPNNVLMENLLQFRPYHNLGISLHTHFHFKMKKPKVNQL